jgi:hypothetical protein
MSDEQQNPIEHERTDEIVCPYCGYYIDEPERWATNRGEQECPECYGNYSYERNRDCTYTTRKTT